MKITIETEAADELVLNWTGADKDRAEAIRRMDMRIFFEALKGETESCIRHELERRSAAEQEADKAYTMAELDAKLGRIADALETLARNNAPASLALEDAQ